MLRPHKKKEVNTFIGGKAAGGGDICVGTGVLGDIVFKNNLVTSADQLMTSIIGTTSNTNFDYNLYANGGSNRYVWASNSQSNFNYFSSFTTWQSDIKADGDSSYVNAAGLDSTGHPQSGSAAIGAGENLTSLGISALNRDKAGVSRPSTGAWDIGAYQYDTTNTLKPNPPSDVRKAQ